MKKSIVNKFDKKMIPTLPRITFGGRIIVVQTEQVAEKAVDYLLTQDILGIDTETRPSFTRGKQYKVALLQVSTHDTCFLFRLNHLGLSPSIIRLLEDTTIPKIGLSLHDDISSLSKRGKFTPGWFIDLQHEMKNIGIEDMSLAKLYANIFGMRISKREQLSNWEAGILNEKQKIYASTDAWTCINLFEEYLRLKDTGDYELVKVPTETEAAATPDTSSDTTPDTTIINKETAN